MNLYERMLNAALILDEEDVKSSILFIEDLSNLDILRRKFQAIDNLNLSGAENERTVELIRTKVQNLLMTMYDYHLHQ
jgi:hypothetical protein